MIAVPFMQQLSRGLTPPLADPFTAKRALYALSEKAEQCDLVTCVEGLQSSHRISYMSYMCKYQPVTFVWVGLQP